MQSPDPSQNFFELFGLKPAFSIDRDELRAQLRRLQSNYHPDRYVNASDLDKRLSMQLTSWVNEAFETLQNPVKRARYLLELSGVEIADDSATTSDAEFLMEQLEIREAVEACREQEDGLQRSHDIEAHLLRRATDLSDQFVQNFNAAEYTAATEAYRKMQFIHRIQQQLGDLQFELEGL